MLMFPSILSIHESLDNEQPFVLTKNAETETVATAVAEQTEIVLLEG
jgi:hypothetical protein